MRAAHKPCSGLEGPDRLAGDAEGIERLRSLGRRVDYVVYPDEGHGFTKRANAEDAYGRIVDFLTRELGV